MQPRSWTFSLVKELNEIAAYLPDWFQPIGAMIEKARLDQTYFNERELAFHIMGQAKPLQQYLLGYLRTDYVAQADAYLTAPRRFTPEKIVKKLLSNHYLFMDDHQGGIRKTGAIPMMRHDAALAAQTFASDRTLQRTAAAMQVCLDQYTDAIREQLVRHYGFPEKSDACNLLSIAKDSEAIWADFTPFLSLNAQKENTFAGAFKTAFGNQAFQSQRGHAVKKCPGQSLAKHFMNTDITELPDGTHIIAKTPREGALPAYFYDKMAKAVPTLSLPAQTLG